MFDCVENAHKIFSIPNRSARFRTAACTQINLPMLRKHARGGKERLSFQLKLMDLSDGLELVQRLSGERPTKYGTARVWRNSIKAAELVAQYLVTAGMVRPVPETGANVLEQILNSWALLHSKLKDVAPTLPGMIRKLIEPAESAQHIYIFCAVLVKHVSISRFLLSLPFHSANYLTPTKLEKQLKTLFVCFSFNYSLAIA